MEARGGQTLNGARAGLARLMASCKCELLRALEDINGFQLVEFIKGAQQKWPTAGRALHNQLRFRGSHALFRLGTGYRLGDPRPQPAHELDPAWPIAFSLQSKLELLAVGAEECHK